MASEFMNKDELEELQIPFADLNLLEILGQGIHCIILACKHYSNLILHLLYQYLCIGEFGIVYKAQFQKPVVAPRSLSEMKKRTSFISLKSQTGSILNKEPPTVAVKTLKGTLTCSICIVHTSAIDRVIIVLIYIICT